MDEDNLTYHDVCDMVTRWYNIHDDYNDCDDEDVNIGDYDDDMA